MTALKRLKAKMVQMYSASLSRGTVDTHTQKPFKKERMSLFHLIKRRSRCEQAIITNVQDPFSRK